MSHNKCEAEMLSQAELVECKKTAEWYITMCNQSDGYLTEWHLCAECYAAMVNNPRNIIYYVKNLLTGENNCGI